MFKGKRTRIILLSLLAMLVVMQFFRIDRSPLPSDPAQDFIHMHQPPAEVASILKRACYDCHSNVIRYPWYSNIAPVSWWLQHHVEEGREHLNFSDWGKYDAEKQEHKLEECLELVKEKEMPLKSYTWMHADARLSDNERRVLSEFLAAVR